MIAVDRAAVFPNILVVDVYLLAGFLLHAVLTGGDLTFPVTLEADDAEHSGGAEVT